MRNATQVQSQAQTAFEALKEQHAWSNTMQAPRLQRVVVSAGVGRMRKDKARLTFVAERLAKITGQRPIACTAKKAIASFKSRVGDVVGYAVTLRGNSMYDFLERLLHITIPRMRDFRGIPLKAIDKMGNITIAVPEHTVFPEVAEDSVQDSFGFAVTIVTTTKNREEALPFLRHIGVPLARA